MQIRDALGLTNKPLEDRGRTGATGRAGDNAATVSGAVAAAVASDQVELSGRSQEMSKAAHTLAATPAVRQDRVAELRRQIDNNEYKVDADKVAQKLIMDFLREGNGLSQ